MRAKNLYQPHILAVAVLIGAVVAVGGDPKPSDTVQRLMSKAGKGDAPSQSELGILYMSGALGLPQDHKKAVHWFRKAADAEHPAGAHHLGYCYENGLGVERNQDRAIELYRIAADKGLELAQARIAGILRELGRVDEAQKYDKMAANHGNVACMREYANYLLTRPIDGERQKIAVEYLQAAARREDGPAYLLLAKWYSGSIPGSPKDYPKMVEHLWEAANRGTVSAQNKLARCFEFGIGVQKDTAIAYRWYRKAAEQNDARALVDVGRCYDTGMGVALDNAAAIQWYRRAAALGYAPGEYSLGLCYEIGAGVAPDLEIALQNYRLAADQEHAPAQYKVGAFMQRGHGGSPDLEGGFRWYTKAVDQGNPDAMRAVAACYVHGAGTEVDLDKAEKYLRAADEHVERNPADPKTLFDD